MLYRLHHTSYCFYKAHKCKQVANTATLHVLQERIMTSQQGLLAVYQHNFGDLLMVKPVAQLAMDYTSL